MGMEISRSLQKLLTFMCFFLFIAGCDKAPTLIIGAYGDSTTIGFQVIEGVPSYTQITSPACTQEILQEEFGSRVAVVNRGVSGIQALTLLKGASDFTDMIVPWEQEMAQTKAKIITINVGINDALYYTRPTPGREPQSPEQFEDTMTQLVEIAVASGKRVILLEPIPTSIPELNKHIALYNVKLQAVATSHGIPIVHKWAYASALNDYNSLLTDGVHPSDELYRKIAQWSAPTISQEVRNLID